MSDATLPELGSARYALVGRLGVGGMAEVFRGWDRQQRRWCAIKLLRRRAAKKPDSRARFLRECETMLDLDHRNVIAALDVVEAERPYLVMELADGGSLEEWVDRHGAMPPRMAVDVAVQICKGVNAAHRAHVIHRDLKPHNILVDRKGYCKITDFGIAMLLARDGTQDIPDARLTATKGVLGTLAYMAPEQKSNPKLADVRTDIYGIGATLYTLVTGETRADLFVVEREPDLLSRLPEPLVPILTRAVAFKPEDRFPDAQALAKALYDCRGSLPPDPADTPPLVGPIPPDPEPPEDDLATVMESGRTPAPAQPPAASAPDDDEVTEPSEPASLPAPVSPVVVETEAELQPQPRWGLRVLALVVVLIGLPVSLDTLYMAQAKRSHDTALAGWLAQIEHEVGLLADLEAIHPDGSELRDQYAMVQSTDQPLARAVLAQRYFDEVQRVLGEAAADPDNREGAQGDLRHAEARVRRIHEQWTSWQAALDTWQERGASFPGSVVVGIGLSPTPPRFTAPE